ncbi:hypothetical protein CEXT_812841 [Caerostris extrusa]|uniref:Uncharacterized protein n=1 Tax=Caerostris extrusa TaxID=172846 RepID=A0AAV4NEQ3_CAEEX|nr:hypothetical protein CEXT_812841 [Caerostris extrusa]
MPIRLKNPSFLKRRGEKWQTRIPPELGEWRLLLVLRNNLQNGAAVAKSTARRFRPSVNNEIFFFAQSGDQQESSPIFHKTLNNETGSISNPTLTFCVE